MCLRLHQVRTGNTCCLIKFMIEDAQLQQALVIWIPYTLTYEADMGLFRDYEGWYLTLMTPIHTKKNQNGIY